MIITIDGPAAAGKGTLANFLSEKYQLAYFDTGMVYRAVGLEMILSQSDLQDENKALSFAKRLTFPRMIELSKNPDFRSTIGGHAASVVAAITSVRESLLKMQQDFSKSPVFADGTKANGAVYDGRDTGTVICPNADVKLFITASSEVRAMRRYKEFAQKANNTKTYEEVLADVIDRDKRDSERESAPLKPADDAVLFDTSNLNIEEVIKTASKIIDSKK